MKNLLAKAILKIKQDENIKINKLVAKEFGTGFAMTALIFNVFDILTKHKTDLYHSYIKRYCRKEFSSLIDTYQKENTEEEYSLIDDSKIVVWTMWWQGVAKAPEIVKRCISSQKKIFSNDKYQYVILDKENYSSYITISKTIVDKVGAGLITITHLSDIIRAELLKKYGGVWIDSTVFITGEFEDEFIRLPFYTNNKASVSSSHAFVPQGRWTSYFLKAEKQDMLFRYMSDAFTQYWERHNTLVDYWLVDYVIDLAYENIKSVRVNIDSVPINNEKIFVLQSLLNTKFNAQLYSELIKNTNIHKLSYKMDCYEYDENENLTFWGYLNQ